MTQTRYTARRPPHFDLGAVPYFVSTRTHESKRVFVGSNASVSVEQLLADRDRYGYLILAFAFMPDHAHFVIVPARGHTISATMRIVKAGLARRLNSGASRKGPIWQDGFYDRVATTLEQLNAHTSSTRTRIRLMLDWRPYPTPTPIRARTVVACGTTIGISMTSDSSTQPGPARVRKPALRGEKLSLVGS